MAPPSNKELKGKVKELKAARTADASKLLEIQQIIDELLALNEDLSTQVTSSNTDDSHTPSTAAQDDGEDTVTVTRQPAKQPQTTQAGHGSSNIYRYHYYKVNHSFDIRLDFIDTLSLLTTFLNKMNAPNSDMKWNRLLTHFLGKLTKWRNSRVQTRQRRRH